MAEYIKRILAKAEFTGNFQNEYPVGQIHALIDCVPAADVRENVHGHWDIVEMKKGEWWHTCSECKATWGSDDGKLDFKFCPNCGTDMQGAQDG